jgi:SP family facilitated glucose transporter-like MFS transporter 8
MGILLVYALGSVLPWRTVAAMGNILPLCALLALFFLPESPHWLARVGRGHEALKALTWLRGGHVAEARSELAVLAARQEMEDAEVRFFPDN